MSMKPILFNTETVRAILDGRKTVTRRVVKLPKNIKEQPDGMYTINTEGDCYEDCYLDGLYADGYLLPKYKVGDILYVKETFCFNYFDECIARNRNGNATAYKADYNKQIVGSVVPEPKWTSSIHMPKSAARIFLKVTDIRVERLQDITEEQAKAEGCIDFNDKIGNSKFDDVMEFDLTARDAFAELWDSTVKEDWQKFASSPWVWVIEFERCEKPEGWEE